MCYKFTAVFVFLFPIRGYVYGLVDFYRLNDSKIINGVLMKFCGWDSYGERRKIVRFGWLSRCFVNSGLLPIIFYYNCE